MPFFEKKIRQNYAVPEQMERELRSAMEFVATGYYRFFAKALTESARNTALEAALCAKLGDACLGLLFERKGSPKGTSVQSGCK